MNYFLLSSSLGSGSTELNSFDSALLKSSVGNYNLVRVSSILPPNMTQKDSIDLSEGSILHTAYTSISSNVMHKTISSAVSVGIPLDDSSIGVIMEYSGYNTKDKAISIVENMVHEAMELRGIFIKEILTVCTSAIIENEMEYISTFACLAMW